MAHMVKHDNAPKPYEVRWSATDPKTGKRKFYKRRFVTWKVADQFKRDIENKAATGLSVDHAAGKKAFASFAESWHAYVTEAELIKPSTSRQYRSILNSTVLPAFAHTPVNAITPADVRAYLQSIKADRSAPTVRRHYGVLRLVLQQAVEDGAIAINPAVGIKRLPQDNRTPFEPMFLDEPEVAALAAALPAPYDFLVRFLAYTGLRVAEASGLNIGHVNLASDRPILVEQTRTYIRGEWEVNRPKTRKTRRVPLIAAWLHDDMQDFLDAHPHRDDPTAPLFPGTAQGHTPRTSGSHSTPDWDKPWEPGVFRKRQFNNALRTAGLPAMRLHDLRHSAASIMLSKGIDPYRVADYLGHSVAMLTKVYAHVMPNDVQADIARFSSDRPAARNLRAV
jgi:integrase